MYHKINHKSSGKSPVGKQLALHEFKEIINVAIGIVEKEWVEY